MGMMTLREMWRQGTEDPSGYLKIAGMAVVTAIIVVTGATLIAQRQNEHQDNWRGRIDLIYAEQVRTNVLLTELIKLQQERKP